ncbi:MAG: RNA methyltransferase [Clostridiales Family XIII bacterium]|jgi:TrmH family RNA methyltransferase|nr:RNA methyltransferase [Clostridiales Family XIII bacterium]
MKLKTRKGREQAGAFLAEGGKLIGEALDAGLTVREVFARSEEALAAAGVADGPRGYILPEQLFSRLAETVHSQGVVAVVDMPQQAALPTGSVVVLDRLQDPGNVGTILRSAYAAGLAGAVIVKGTADPYSDKVVRAAAGALFRLPLTFAEDGQAALELLTAAGIRPVAAVMDGGVVYTQADLTGNVALLVGNEGGGISEALLTGAAEKVTIPMQAGSESLNAAVAASVLMFEKRRQDIG